MNPNEGRRGGSMLPHIPSASAPVIAHRGGIPEGILDYYAHFPLFSGAFAQFPGMPSLLMMMMLKLYMMIYIYLQNPRIL